MATLRNKRKLAAVTRETQEENPRNGQSRNTSIPRINEEYITQVSEEIEGRITKKLSQEFNRIESRISDALSKLDEFLSNQQIQTHSKTVPGTFRNTNVENQGTNEDDSQSDPHPEGGLFRSQTTQNSGPEAGHYTRKAQKPLLYTTVRLLRAQLQALHTFSFDLRMHIEETSKKNEMPSYFKRIVAKHLVPPLNISMTQQSDFNFHKKTCGAHPIYYWVNKV